MVDDHPSWLHEPRRLRREPMDPEVERLVWPRDHESQAVTLREVLAIAELDPVRPRRRGRAVRDLNRQRAVRRLARQDERRALDRPAREVVPAERPEGVDLIERPRVDLVGDDGALYV